MKSAYDPRHQKRRQIVKELFAYTFAPSQEISQICQDILNSKDELDQLILAAAPQWPVDKLNKIDLAILRLSIFEMKKQKNPPKVIIDEAVELAKEFGSESSPSFVNGVLGFVYSQLKTK